MKSFADGSNASGFVVMLSLAPSIGSTLQYIALVLRICDGDIHLTQNAESFQRPGFAQLV
jgi:hypothetical protein